MCLIEPVNLNQLLRMLDHKNTKKDVGLAIKLNDLIILSRIFIQR